MNEICKLDDIIPETGVCALVGGEQVAIFRTQNDDVFAMDNFDPFSKANVISRGLLGSCEIDGQKVRYVASPMYKQRFDLATGKCIDDERVSLRSYPVKVNHGAVFI
jgi:nitrite reductase (NADH) small subunit